jgi:hypothetical protein
MKLSTKIIKEAKRIAGGLHRLNNADRYGFSVNVNKKEIAYGEFLSPYEGEKRVEWIVELATGNIRPAKVS